MSETVEKKLKDYKGFSVWKVTDNKGYKCNFLVKIFRKAVIYI